MEECMSLSCRWQLGSLGVLGGPLLVLLLGQLSKTSCSMKKDSNGMEKFRLQRRS
jgi:hypothetical protein